MENIDFTLQCIFKKQNANNNFIESENKNAYNNFLETFPIFRGNKFLFNLLFVAGGYASLSEFTDEPNVFGAEKYIISSSNCGGEFSIFDKSAAIEIQNILSNNYGIVDKCGQIVRFGGGDIVIFGSKQEAESDLLTGDRVLSLIDIIK